MAASIKFGRRQWLRKPRRIIWGILLLLSLWFVWVPLNSYATPVESVPNPRVTDNGWITDMANVLHPSIKASLNDQLSQLEADNGVEFAIVTVPDTRPYATPKEFTTALFNHWGVGKEGTDNGLLMMVSMGDRRIEIETGYGVEGLLPDAQVGHIIEGQILPQFRAGDPEGGIVAGVAALVPLLRGETFDGGVSNIWTFAPSPLIAGAWVLLVVGSGIALFCFRQARQLALTPYPIPARGKFRVENMDRYNAKVSGRVRVGVISVSFGLLFLFLVLTHIAGNLMMSLVYAGIGSLVMALFGGERLTEQWFNPNKQSRSHRLFSCQTCDTSMVWVEAGEVAAQLSQPQQVAARLGSVVYEGWRCPTCSPQLQDGFHLRAYVLGAGCRECPHCQELTMTQVHKTLVPATYEAAGLGLTLQTCQCCGHQSQREYVIPQLQRPSSSSSSSSSYSGGSSSSSFGGGSSGGGGAGGSW